MRSIQDLVATSSGQSVGEILKAIVVLILLSVLESKTVVSHLFPSYLFSFQMVAVFYCRMSAQVSTVEGINKSVENGKRRVVVTTNVERHDWGLLFLMYRHSFKAYTLPSGYWIEYGGQFENLASAKARMQIVIPLANHYLYFTDGGLSQCQRKSIGLYRGTLCLDRWCAVPLAKGYSIIDVSWNWLCLIWCCSPQWTGNADLY